MQIIVLSSTAANAAVQRYFKRNAFVKLETKNENFEKYGYKMQSFFCPCIKLSKCKR
jgi:hypothetical protein